MAFAAVLCTPVALAHGPVAFNVNSQATFDAALDAIVRNTGSEYTINITGGFTMTGQGAPIGDGNNVTINGNGHTIDGDNRFRPIFADKGNITINNLTIANGRAKGGDGGNSGDGGAGGGGLGAGGGLFVNSTANVTLVNVDFTNGSAVGGNGGSTDGAGIDSSEGGGGGGGLGGDGGSARLNPGGNVTATRGGAGGGGFFGAGGNVPNESRGGGAGGGTFGNGGNASSASGGEGGGGGGGYRGDGGDGEPDSFSGGGGGGVLITDDGGEGTSGGGPGSGGGGDGGSGSGDDGGRFGGGGGGGGDDPGGVGGEYGGGGGGGEGERGGSGGRFGGGGGGGGADKASSSGFFGGNGGDFGGGGGSGDESGAGNGGYGGGGGGAGADGGTSGTAGFGGGAGGNEERGGNGGSGFGGAVFVREGGTLTIRSGSAAGGSVAAGAGGTGAAGNGSAGQAAGSGIFLHGVQVTVNPQAGETVMISDTIADSSASVGKATSGSIYKQDSGTLVLNGANTFRGGITVEDGTLRLGHSQAAGTGTITTFGSVIDYADGISVANVVAISSDTTKFNVDTGSATQAGNVSEAGGSRPLEKTGAGTLILTGANSYTGTTTVSAGRLINNGSLQSPVVTIGGTYGGSGSSAGLTLGAGGTVAPGNSIGTLGINGNVVFGSGATYEVEVASDGTSDLINATGTTTINGGTVSVIALSPVETYSDGQRYTIITSAGGVAGQFSGIIDNSAFLDFVLGYDPTNVFLTLARIATFPDVARTFNQRTAATALRTLGTSGDALAVNNALLGLSASQAQAAFDDAGGEIHADGQAIAADAANRFNAMLMGQAQRPSVAGNGAPAPSAAIAYTQTHAADSRVAAAFERIDRRRYGAHHGKQDRVQPKAYAVWAGGFGGIADVDGDGNAAGWDSKSAGFAGGVEADLSRILPMAARIGIAAGYSRSNGDTRNQSANLSGTHVGVYGQAGADRFAPGLAARGAVSYAAQDIDTGRRIAFGTINRTATARYDADTVSAAAEVRYGVDVSDIIPAMNGRTILSPLARIDAAFVSTSGFAETGAGALNLTGTARSFDQAVLGLGVSVGGSYRLGAAMLQAGFSVAWEHIAGDIRPAAGLVFAGAPTGFTTLGPDESRNRLRLGSSADVRISDNLSINLAADAVLSKDRTELAGNAALRIRF